MAANMGAIDYGSGRYKISGGPDDGHEFHAGDSFEVLYHNRWLPAVIEHNGEQWVFMWPIDERDVPTDLYGLPVRLARR